MEKNEIFTNPLVFKVKKWVKNIRIWRIPEAIYLCIRFPFLYPRNRFSGKHYDNRKLQGKRCAIFRKWDDFSNNNKMLYYEKFGPESLMATGNDIQEYNAENISKCFVASEYIMKMATPRDRFLYWWYDFIEKFIGVFHIIPTYTEIDCMLEGWRKRFGIQFCKELKEAILKSGGRKLMKEFRIHQIKEKWGAFTFYCNSYTNEVERVIRKYEYISRYVCIKCGEDAVKKTTGWICPYCEHCLPKNQKWLWIDPIYGWSSFQKKEDNEKIKKEW